MRCILSSKGKGVDVEDVLARRSGLRLALSIRQPYAELILRGKKTDFGQLSRVAELPRAEIRMGRSARYAREDALRFLRAGAKPKSRITWSWGISGLPAWRFFDLAIAR